MLLWAAASVGFFEALACLPTHVANSLCLVAQSTRRRSRADIEAVEASLFAFPPSRQKRGPMSLRSFLAQKVLYGSNGMQPLK